MRHQQEHESSLVQVGCWHGLDDGQEQMRDYRPQACCPLSSCRHFFLKSEFYFDFQLEEKGHSPEEGAPL